MKIQDPALLFAFILTAILLALMVAPRPKQNSEAFAKAYAEYREARETPEVVSWSR